MLGYFSSGVGFLTCVCLWRIYWGVVIDQSSVYLLSTYVVCGFVFVGVFISFAVVGYVCGSLVLVWFLVDLVHGNVYLVGLVLVR